jgi:hypothetical protein
MSTLNNWELKVKKKNNMKNDKIINGQIVRKNPHHRGMWDIIETRCGVSTGRSSYTGSLKEIQAVIKLSNRILPREKN